MGNYVLSGNAVSWKSTGFNENVGLLFAGWLADNDISNWNR